MYVCICHSVTDKDIKQAAKNGVYQMSELKALTGCGSGCGSCSDMAAEMLAKQHQSNIPDFLRIQKHASSVPQMA